MVVKFINRYIYAQRDYHDLQKMFPNSTYTSIDNRGNFVVRVLLTPDNLGDVYDVEFCGGVDTGSKIYWHDSEIDAELAKKIPHNFGYDEDKKALRLCLYYLGEYDSKMRYKNTIVPWTMEWFYFFEYFLITGKWLGKGIIAGERGAK